MRSSSQVDEIKPSFVYFLRMLKKLMKLGQWLICGNRNDVNKNDVNLRTNWLLAVTLAVKW